MEAIKQVLYVVESRAHAHKLLERLDAAIALDTIYSGRLCHLRAGLVSHLREGSTSWLNRFVGLYEDAIVFECENAERRVE